MYVGTTFNFGGAQIIQVDIFSTIFNYFFIKNGGAQIIRVRKLYGFLRYISWWMYSYVSTEDLELFFISE